MSFSYEYKLEIIDSIELEQNSLRAFMIGVILSSFYVCYEGEKNFDAYFITEHKNIADFLKKELEKDLNFDGSINIIEQPISEMASRYYLEITDIYSYLYYLGISDGYKKNNFDNNLLYEKDFKFLNKFSDDDIILWVKGVFLASSSIVNPDKAYHLELVIKTPNLAKKIVNLFDKNFDVKLKLTNRKNVDLIYVKGKDVIADILSIVGANKKRLILEDIIVQKSMKSKINRIVNCDTANIRKASTTFKKHLKALKIIMLTKNLDLLDERLISVAILRLSYPYYSLSELAELSVEKITKSGINHRLGKICNIAKSLDIENSNISVDDKDIDEILKYIKGAE